jgi:hypothetical protein
MVEVSFVDVALVDVVLVDVALVDVALEDAIPPVFSKSGLPPKLLHSRKRMDPLVKFWKSVPSMLLIVDASPL